MTNCLKTVVSFITKSSQAKMDDILNNNIAETKAEDTVPSAIDGIQLTGEVLFFIFTAIGLASNIALIGIYKKKDLTLRFNSLMLTLASFDLTTIAFFILTAILQLTIGHDLNFVFLYLDGSLIICSAYTMVAIAVDRYLFLCRGITNTRYKLPIKWTIVRFFVVGLVLMSPYHMWNPGHFAYFVVTRIWQCIVQGLIPCTLLLILTITMYKKLQHLKEDEELADYANEALYKALKKSILRVRLALLISSVFVVSQILVWLPLPYDVRYIQMNVIKFWCVTIHS